MKFLLALLVVSVLFWLPWDSWISSGAIQVDGNILESSSGPDSQKWIPVTGGGQAYEVDYGDTLSGIALRYGYTVEQLMLANPSVRDPDRIYAGQYLILPVR